MAYRIFISHSSVNKREAEALKWWLEQQDPALANEIFLDTDRRTGLQVGVRWKDEVHRASTSCETLICLLSHEWAKSRECEVEFRFAEGFRKQILCAALEPSPADDLTRDYQRCSLYGAEETDDIAVAGGPPVQFSTEGLLRLRDAICGPGIGAESFVWAPDKVNGAERSAYRGWELFEEQDAAVFFGRDTEIRRALDAMRCIRGMQLPSPVRSLFVILGPSGTGKSSFLRAGLLPRLRRDSRNFVILGEVRPDRDALTGDAGLAKAIEVGRRKVGLTRPALGDIESLCEQGDCATIAALLTEIRVVAGERLGLTGGDKSALLLPTLVLPVDQAEELFNAGNQESSDWFLAVLASVVAILNEDQAGLIAVATIRNDRHKAMQTHPELAGVGAYLFDELKPMPMDKFRDVITGPAERLESGLVLADDLVDRLVQDAGAGSGTLPMLSLALARLYEKYGASGKLTVEQYERIGGIRRVVQNLIDEILSERGTPEREAELEILRETFIPALVSVNSDTNSSRRVAMLSDLPKRGRALIDEFVQKRLLVTSGGGPNETVVEVALEALLDEWDELRGWVIEQRHELMAADDLEREAAIWSNRGRNPGWLLTGARLEEAENLIQKTGFRKRLKAALGFVKASVRGREKELAEEAARRQAELTEAWERLRESTSSRLVAEAQGILTGTRVGSDAKALHQLLAARLLTKTPDDGAIFNAVVRCDSTMKIVEAPGLVYDVAVSPDGERIVSVGVGNGVPRLWDVQTGQAVAMGPFAGHTEGIVCVAFSPDGDRLATASEDGTARIWNARTGLAVGEPLTHQAKAHGIAFSPDGHVVITTGELGAVRLWDAFTGAPIGEPIGSHTDAVMCVAFSPDGQRIVTGSLDSTARIWDARTGAAVGEPLTGHTDRVWSVAFSPDGRRVATAGADATVRIWAAHSGFPLGEPMADHTDEVWRVVFSPDGDRLASAGRDCTVRLWDAHTGESIGQPLLGHSGAVWGVAFSPDGRRIASASSDSTVRFWDAATGDDIAEPLGHSDVPWALAYSPDGRRLATAGSDGSAQLWDTQDGECLTRHQGAPTCVAFSPDGTLIATGGNDATVRMWDGSTGHPVGRPMHGHVGRVNAVAFSPDGRLIATGAEDDVIRLWNASGESIGDGLQGHFGTVNGLTFSADGRRLASASNDGTARIWSRDTRQQIGESLAGHDSWVFAVAFSPDGRRLATGAMDDKVRLWDVDSGAAIGAPLVGHTGWVWCLAFDPSGTFLTTGSVDATLRTWDAATGKPVGQPRYGHKRDVESVAYSPDGSWLVTGSIDGTLRIWKHNVLPPLDGFLEPIRSMEFSRDRTVIVTVHELDVIRLWEVRTGKQVGPTLAGQNVCFSVDGRRLATATEDGVVQFWDARTGEADGPAIQAHADIVNGMTFSRDGTRIATAGYDNAVRLWDVARGELIAERTEHSGWVFCVARSPDDRLLASCSADLDVRLWDAKSLEPMGVPMVGHTHWVCYAVFSPDSRRLATSGYDATVRVWDVSTGELESTMRGHRGPVYAVAFSPDGSRLVSGSADTTVRLWDCATGAPIGDPIGFPKSVFTVEFSADGGHVLVGTQDGSLARLPALGDAGDLRAKLTANMSRHQWEEWISPDLDYVPTCPNLAVPGQPATTSTPLTSAAVVHGDSVSPGDPQLPAADVVILRTTIFPRLAAVDPEGGRFVRRVARYRDLPEESQPLVDGLVGKGLVVKDILDGDVVVEIASDTLLHSWPDLRDWLRAQRSEATGQVGARIFLSYAGPDAAEAIALKRYLVEQDPSLADDIFLDADIDDGIRVGHRWRDELRRAAERCEAVICLLSRSYARSTECLVEYRTAEALNKCILCVRLEPSDADDLASAWGRYDLFGDGEKTVIEVDGQSVEFATEGLIRLRDEVRSDEPGPDSFAWPPPGDPERAPYRGARPMESVDAAVFFGREADIVRALDKLRDMRRQGGPGGMLLIVGPSGCGKSCFLRAGLLPRLARRDRDFTVLDEVRARDALPSRRDGFAAAIHSAMRSAGLTGQFADVAAAVADGDAERLAEWLTAIRTARTRPSDRGDVEATLVLPLDQADQLLAAEDADESRRLLALLRELMDRLNSADTGLIVVATLRSGRLEHFRDHPSLAGVPMSFFDIAAIPATAFRDVILGPARRASASGRRLDVEPALVEVLLSDIVGANSLPLLALTLSRLYARYGADGLLTLADYDRAGGARHVIRREFDDLLCAEPDMRGTELEALRAAFIPWLVTVAEDGAPQSRIAYYDDLPEAARPLVDRLVERRLLVTGSRGGEMVVGVADEAMLWQWDELAHWVSEEREDLKTVDDLERGASAWREHDCQADWLLTGVRLRQAERLAQSGTYGRRLSGIGDFIASSRQSADRRSNS